MEKLTRETLQEQVCKVVGTKQLTLRGKLEVFYNVQAVGDIVVFTVTDDIAERKSCLWVQKELMRPHKDAN